MERLQKVIASRGFCSRRKAEDLITAGKVMVDGEVVNTLGTKVSSDADIVIDGKHLTEETKEYYLLSKPRGYICALSDEHNRPLVTDLIDTKARIFPVGRLDYDTTGLIILTNDGELANILMHPKNEVPKEYLAKVEGNLTMTELFSLKKGIVVDGEMTIPLKVKIKRTDKVKNVDMVEIVLAEGRNHIVKNIFAAIHHPVIKLTRIKYGFLTEDKLQSGEYRYLTKEEVRKLYAYKH
jgi:23S rRNA pseudouridine2605 synthase